MQIITTPDGRRIPLDGCTYQAIDNELVIVPITAPVKYACVNSTGSAGMVTQIDTGLAAATGVNSNTVLSDSGAIVWTSLTPNTGTINTDYSGTIAGTGFSGSGIDGFNLYSGAVPVITNIPFTINSDTVIKIAISSLYATPAGTYTLFFTTNSGLNYTTTALTLTLS